MDPMIINDNNEDLISDDDIPLEQLKATGKPPFWQMEILEQAVNDNADLNIPKLNESDSSNQPCRNSIQVSFSLEQLQVPLFPWFWWLSYDTYLPSQGKALIVDERGIVCSRHDVLPNGCCRIEQRQTSKNEKTPSMAVRERYSCKTCNPQGCCTIYEYCVSCCLHPGKVDTYMCIILFSLAMYSKYIIHEVYKCTIAKPKYFTKKVTILFSL